jgi:hypothetical protein
VANYVEVGAEVVDVELGVEVVGIFFESIETLGFDMAALFLNVKKSLLIFIASEDMDKMAIDDK